MPGQNFPLTPNCFCRPKRLEAHILVLDNWHKFYNRGQAFASKKFKLAPLSSWLTEILFFIGCI